MLAKRKPGQRQRPLSKNVATITVVQAAARLGIGRNQVYEAAARGDLPALRIGHRWVIPAAAFDRWLACEPLPK
jgi:excisionase family DNA binding protein